LVKFSLATSLYFNALAGGIAPANIRINFTSSETRMIVLADAEDCTNIICLDIIPERDGQTDRSAVLSQRSALRVMATRCKSFL